jgi:hypothetical protein
MFVRSILPNRAPADGPWLARGSSAAGHAASTARRGCAVVSDTLSCGHGRRLPSKAAKQRCPGTPYGLARMFALPAPPAYRLTTSWSGGEGVPHMERYERARRPAGSSEGYPSSLRPSSLCWSA